MLLCVFFWFASCGHAPFSVLHTNQAQIKTSKPAHCRLPALLAGGDVAAQTLAFMHTADLARLLQTNRTLRALFLPPADSATSTATDGNGGSGSSRGARRVWETVLAGDLARYRIPPEAAAGGWATGRGLVVPSAVRWCWGEEKEAEMAKAKEGSVSQWSFRIADLEVERCGEAFDPEGGADGKGALYAFGGERFGQLRSDTRERTVTSGWRTLRIRGR
jgi:hypothetical protein